MRGTVRTLTSLLIGVCVVTGLTPAAASASAILYEQLPTFPGTSTFRTSYGDSGSSYFLTYDNFTLTDTSLVTTLTWQGSYQDFVTPANNPVTPNSTSFSISFWGDSGGQPGSLLLSVTIPIASIGMTFVGLSATNTNVFDYQATLPLTFVATGGTAYWLSIFSNSSSSNPLWGWRTGAGGDAFSFQDNFGTGTSSAVPFDRAFSLSGDVAPVPEPGSMTLLTTGIFGLALWTRRRSSRRP